MSTPIATLLRRAADEFLWNGVGNYECRPHNYTRRYSCDALRQVPDVAFVYSDALHFLAALGVRTGGLSEFVEFGGPPAGPFHDPGDTEDAQAARFLWLDFAALVAEEWGL